MEDREQKNLNGHEYRVVLVALQKPGNGFSMGIHSIAAAIGQVPGLAHVRCLDLSLIHEQQESLRRQYPHDSRWIHANPLDWLLRYLDRVAPDVIGISAKWGSSGELKNLLQLIAESSILWKKRPQIIVGNSEAIMNPINVIDLARSTLPEHFPDVLVCTGEGEETLVMILQRLPDLWPDLIREIPNLYFYDRTRLVIECTPKKMFRLIN